MTGVIVLAIVIVSLSMAEMYKYDSQLVETNTTIHMNLTQSNMYEICKYLIL